MGILRNIGNIIAGDPEPRYQGTTERAQWMDGFRRGFPLEGQPNYPEHNTEAYLDGLKYGKKANKRGDGKPIQYEISPEDEDVVYCLRCRITHGGGQC